MNQVLNMKYSSSITNLCEINPSFDKGVLKICYTGKNRNGSYFAKEDIERCLPSIYNCPIVCNYDRESDEIGGHDVKVVRTNDGGLKLINMTVPVGVIPESASTWFEEVTEEDGTTHEYLFADALIWKRQEAYEKIKNDGFEGQSMEIDVKSGEQKDDSYHIYDFNFTAFCLLGTGIEPCFESASIEMFSKQDFKEELSKMMEDLKDNYETIYSKNLDEDIHPQTESTEGGNETLDNEINITEDVVVEEPAVDNPDQMQLDFGAEEVTADAPEVENEEQDFELNSNLRAFISEALSAETYVNRYGEVCRRYHMVDYDEANAEVYCEDASESWHIYGFKYSVDADKVAIDTSTRRRKKYAIVDYNDGDVVYMPTVIEYANSLEEKVASFAETEAKYAAAVETIEGLNKEIEGLKNYKADVETAKANAEREELFARFCDLECFDEFAAIKENAMNMDVQDIEEKCFALRGRYGVVAKAADNKSPKIVVEKDTDSMAKKPYGGIVEEYQVV